MSGYKNLPELELKYKSGTIEKVKISSSFDTANLLRKLFNADTIEYREEVVVIYLNSANKTIGWIKHSTGGMCQSVLDNKMILTTGLLCGAVAMILSHNHPSGQLCSSPEDDRATKALKSACDVIGIRFLDHVILSGENERYYSYSDEGKL